MGAVDWIGAVVPEYSSLDTLVERFGVAGQLARLVNSSTGELIGVFIHDGSQWSMIGDLDMTRVSSSTPEITIGAGETIQVDSGAAAFVYGSGLALSGSISYTFPGLPSISMALSYVGTEYFSTVDQETGIILGVDAATDGDMEASGTGDWLTVNSSVAKSALYKVLGTQSMLVIPDGVALGHVYQAIPSSDHLLRVWSLDDGTTSRPCLGLIAGGTLGVISAGSGLWQRSQVFVRAQLRLYPHFTIGTAQTYFDNISCRRALI